MNSTLKSLVFWVVLVVVGVIIWNFSTKFGNQSSRLVSFTEFLSSVKTGNVARVVITGQDITGVTKAGDNFRTYAPSQYDGLVNELIERGVVVQAREPTASPWASLLYSWAPVLLMIGFWIFFMRQMQSGGNKALSFGKSKAKLSSSSAEEGDVQGRRRRRRSEGRAPGDHRVPQGAAEISEARRQDSEGRPADGPSRHGQDAAWRAPSRVKPTCRSSRSAARTSSRCSSASAPRASGTCSSRVRRTPRASSSSTRLTPWAGTVAPGSAAGTMSASRRSISCWSKWTASSRTKA